ncbi:MAG: ice-binding family protein [bacterium]|nr:ice-binding family protein [bacterium]
MKNINKIFTIALSIAVILGITGPTPALAATDPGLGAAATFSIIAQTAITGTGTISGDVGLNSTGAGITALTAGDVGGTIYSTDGVAPSTAILDAAVQANLSTANGNISGQGSTASVGPALDGETLTTGVYDIGAGRLNGGVLTLDGPGIYLFRASSDFISSGSINLTNGARACDVYWQVASLATINGSEFTGTIIAGTGVHFGADVALDGRALALGGDVTLLNNTISGPTCADPEPEPATLNVVKTVINDNGGAAVASDFTVTVTGTNVSSGSFAGSEDGVEVTLDAGAYSIAETAGPSGYLASGSGDCSGTIAAGETKTCTITNDDIAPQLIVNKIVINDSGRTKAIADFSFFIDGGSVASGIANTTTIGLHTVSETADSGYTTVIGGNCAADGTITLALGDVKTCTITNDDIAPVADPSPASGGAVIPFYPPVPPLIDVVKVPSPLALPGGPGAVTYTYTLRNIGTVAVRSITMVDDTCSPITLISGDSNGNAQLEVNETWRYTCSTTLSKTRTNIVTAIGWANNISATDIASATVVVGVPLVPPLIHVTKVPSPLALPAPGGAVTYTYAITNPGTAALSNVSIADDKCTGLPGQIAGHPGDLNQNNLLESNETWQFTCQSNLTKTTTNTGTVSGRANGLTATDFAIATVVVSPAITAPVVPKLPDTGYSAGTGTAGWGIALLLGMILTALASGIVLKKQRA